MSNVIVIPVVVGREMTKKAIQSALAQDIGDIVVIVVFNGCVDESQAYLQGYYWGDHRVRFISHSMRSLNAVWNQMLEKVFETERYCLVINNDIVMRTDTYRHLLNHGSLFVTGVSTDGSIDSCDPGSSSPHPDFSCFLIRRQCWAHVGPFDEGFWAYASDGDYHLRMHSAGVEAVSLAVPFYHPRSSTIRLVSNEVRDALQVRADADRAYFKRKWGFNMWSEEYGNTFRKVAPPSDKPTDSAEVETSVPDSSSPILPASVVS